MTNNKTKEEYLRKYMEWLDANEPSILGHKVNCKCNFPDSYVKDVIKDTIDYFYLVNSKNKENKIFIDSITWDSQPSSILDGIAMPKESGVLTLKLNYAKEKDYSSIINDIFLFFDQCYCTSLTLNGKELILKIILPNNGENKESIRIKKESIEYKKVLNIHTISDKICNVLWFLLVGFMPLMFIGFYNLYDPISSHQKAIFNIFDILTLLSYCVMLVAPFITGFMMTNPRNYSLQYRTSKAIILVSSCISLLLIALKAFIICKSIV